MRKRPRASGSAVDQFTDGPRELIGGRKLRVIEIDAELREVRRIQTIAGPGAGGELPPSGRGIAGCRDDGRHWSIEESVNGQR